MRLLDGAPGYASIINLLLCSNASTSAIYPNMMPQLNRSATDPKSKWLVNTTHPPDMCKAKLVQEWAGGVTWLLTDACDYATHYFHFVENLLGLNAAHVMMFNRSDVVRIVFLGCRLQTIRRRRDIISMNILRALWPNAEVCTSWQGGFHDTRLPGFFLSRKCRPPTAIGYPLTPLVTQPLLVALQMSSSCFA